MTGTASVTELIQAVETADSKVAIITAVRQLAAARDTVALPTLIQVLGYNNPGAAVAAVDGLVALGQEAVPALLAQLDGYNYGARAWAIRALALIGDPRSLAVLLETAAGDFALSVRRAAVKGIGTIHWSLMPPEQVIPAQAQVLQTLIQTTADPEWVVRYATVVGLYTLDRALPPSTRLTDHQKIVACLRQITQQDQTLAVRARAQLALNELHPLTTSG
ncbi:MAG: HEAT repeat domain-containing protein [Nodosilinea sp.]